MSVKLELGIYIHIPFCERACSYCNFYFTTSKKYIDPYIEALGREINYWADRYGHYTIKTIYFGGGTPSILSIKQLSFILSNIHKAFPKINIEECSFEANPEHLSLSYIKDLKQIGINRLSLGVQSLDNADLKWMRRNHTEYITQEILQNIILTGFKSYTLDIIYGTPYFEKNQILLEAFYKQITPPHISAYALTIEKKTYLHYLHKQKKINLPNEDIITDHYYWLCQLLKNEKYEHYEISNFAQKGHRAIHNSRYWDGHFYLGMGASAHGFINNMRYQNISSHLKYIQYIHQKKCFFEIENREAHHIYHEYLINKFRTIEGLSENQMQILFPKYFSYFLKKIKNLCDKNLVSKKKSFYYMNETQWLLSNMVLRELFLEE